MNILKCKTIYNFKTLITIAKNLNLKKNLHYRLDNILTSKLYKKSIHSNF